VPSPAISPKRESNGSGGWRPRRTLAESLALTPDLDVSMIYPAADRHEPRKGCSAPSPRAAVAVRIGVVPPVAWPGGSSEVRGEALWL
jgi:hypothetical protein